MRCIGLALGLVAFTAAVGWADTPEWSSGQAAETPLPTRGRLFAGQNWWTRFGEPVNATALAEDLPAKGGGFEAVGPMPMYGGDYIYGPGSCECAPPCIDHLWAGYFQNPLRCHGHGLLGHRHCGHCRGGHGMGKGRACETSCVTKADCGCADKVGCTSVAADCGCKPVCGSCKRFHLHGKWKGMLAHWHRPCDSCAAPLGCGCAAPLDVGKPMQKQTNLNPPIPLPEDAALLTLPLVNERER